MKVVPTDGRRRVNFSIEVSTELSHFSLHAQLSENAVSPQSQWGAGAHRSTGPKVIKVIDTLRYAARSEKVPHS